MNLVEKNMNYPFKDLNEIMLKFMLKQKSKFKFFRLEAVCFYAK